MIKINNKKVSHNLGIVSLASFLTLALSSILFLGQASATGDAIENCFKAKDDFTNLEEVYLNDVVIFLNSTCEMRLYYLDISFAGTEGDGELTALEPSSYIGSYDTYADGLRIQWPDADGLPYDDVGSRQSLFYYSYEVDERTTTLKRSLPITINEVRYDMGDGIKTAKNIVLDATATITPDENKDVLMVGGVKSQEVSYTGQPVVLEGELTVEENTDEITADNLAVRYYKEDRVSEISQPSEPGSYLAEYYYEDNDHRASLRVPFSIKDYVNVNVDIWSGHGEVSAPRYIDKGSNLHVDITPAAGYEVVWVEYNGEDVTDLLNSDNSLDIADVNEDVEIVVAFRPVYQVVKGDGSKYTIGSGENLSFVVDKDPASYTDGMVVITVDDKPVDLENDSLVEPEKQTTTLLSSYLDTLAPGEHKIEIYFFDEDDLAGIARATFTVAAADESKGDDTEDRQDDSEDSGSEDAEIVIIDKDTPSVPNTGDKTAAPEASIALLSLSAAAVAGSAIAIAVLFTIKKRHSN